MLFMLGAGFFRSFKLIFPLFALSCSLGLPNSAQLSPARAFSARVCVFGHQAENGAGDNQGAEAVLPHRIQHCEPTGGSRHAGDFRVLVHGVAAQLLDEEPGGLLHCEIFSVSLSLCSPVF